MIRNVERLLKRAFVLIAIVAFLASCASRKKIVYFNDIDKISRIDSVTNFQPVTIQPGDILLVTISTIDREISQLFNPTAVATNGNPIAPGYLVDQNGEIELPMVGKVKVSGKTTAQITTDIKVALDRSIKNAFVSTRLLNFRISILGDVARPGNYSIGNERVTVLEALSLAGDANLTANKNDILLIREREGKKKYITLNLNDSKTLSSPYFYLTNNDVIYVKPGTNRVIANTTAFQLLPTIFSAISLSLVIYNSLRR